MEKLEYPWGNVKMVALGNCLVVPQKVNLRISI